MAENVMYICGLSMEMELAKEMGTIGKCEGCLYAEGFFFDNTLVDCREKGVVSRQEDCDEWIVDHR